MDTPLPTIAVTIILFAVIFSVTLHLPAVRVKRPSRDDVTWALKSVASIAATVYYIGKMLGLWP